VSSKQEHGHRSSFASASRAAFFAFRLQSLRSAGVKVGFVGIAGPDGSRQRELDHEYASVASLSWLCVIQRGFG
jgi:hypothetical protein